MPTGKETVVFDSSPLPGITSSQDLKPASLQLLFIAHQRSAYSIFTQIAFDLGGLPLGILRYAGSYHCNLNQMPLLVAAREQYSTLLSKCISNVGAISEIKMNSISSWLPHNSRHNSSVRRCTTRESTGEIRMNFHLPVASTICQTNT